MYSNILNYSMLLMLWLCTRRLLTMKRYSGIMNFQHTITVLQPSVHDSQSCNEKAGSSAVVFRYSPLQCHVPLAMCPGNQLADESSLGKTNSFLIMSTVFQWAWPGTSFANGRIPYVLRTCSWAPAPPPKYVPLLLACGFH